MDANAERERLRDVSRRLAELHARVDARFGELRARQRKLLEEVLRRKDARAVERTRRALEDVDGQV